MSDVEKLALGRLNKCLVWVEQRTDNNFIHLQAITAGGFVINHAFEENVLHNLLKAGKIVVSIQPRLTENPNSLHAKLHITTQKYWSVVRDQY